VFEPRVFAPRAFEPWVFAPPAFEPRALPAGTSKRAKILWRENMPATKGRGSRWPWLRCEVAMFVPLIVTVNDKRRPLAHGVRRVCGVCGVETPHHLVEVRRQLALFFIPVWRWNKRPILVCNVCGNAQPISPEAAEEIRRSQGPP
jgi:hypothetical protein